MFTVLPYSCFKTTNPIIIGVNVKEGKIKLGMTVTCPSKNIVLGKIENIQSNHRPLQEAKQGDNVCLCIKPLAPFTEDKLPMFWNDVYHAKED
jgi:translation initiation factor 5B